MADALRINGAGLSPADHNYALSAHFDFVVGSERDPVSFAVEFDGPYHDSEPEQIIRDAMKNRICDLLGMPLLRIDAGYLRAIRRNTIVQWLAECWMMWEGFTLAQESGTIPWTESFDPNLVVGWYRTDSGRSVRWENPDLSELTELIARGEAHIDFPYDLALPERRRLSNFERQNLIKSVCPEIWRDVTDRKGYASCLTVVHLTDGRLVASEGRCRSFRFPPVGPWDLAEELATIDVTNLTRDVLRGKTDASTPADVERARNRMRAFGAICQGYVPSTSSN
jgi:hypothetical protein